MNCLWQVKINNGKPLLFLERKDAEAEFKAHIQAVGVRISSVDIERVDIRDVDPRDLERCGFYLNCRPATPEEVVQGKACWCGGCHAVCVNQGKDALVVCKRFKDRSCK